MPHTDEDGMVRVDMEWRIEGARETRTGRLFGLHAQEAINARAAVKALAKRGDTVIIKEN